MFNMSHTQPVIRAIEVSYTAAKMRFDKIFDLTAGVLFLLITSPVWPGMLIL